MSGVHLTLDDASLEAIAQRAAEILQEQQPAARSTPWRTPAEAAEYLRCGRQRIYDLVHAGKLDPRRDGARLLFHLDDLDRYVNGGAA